jgi:hypothetical protein
MEIYTTIPPTPLMTEVVVKIMIELLSVLALASKQIKQGRLSKYAVTHTVRDLMCRREIHQKVTGRERDRDSPPKIGSTDARRGSDDCCTDIGCRPQSHGQHESSNGRCAIVI